MKRKSQFEGNTGRSVSGIFPWRAGRQLEMRAQEKGWGRNLMWGVTCLLKRELPAKRSHVPVQAACARALGNPNKLCAHICLHGYVVSSRKVESTQFIFSSLTAFCIEKLHHMRYEQHQENRFRL